MTSLLRQVVSAVFFEYYTPKIVHIESKLIGITSRIIQFIVVTYVVGYVLVYQKGYQSFDSVQAAVTTKVKGVLMTNFTEIRNPTDKLLYNRIWDVTDYVIPPAENGAVFIMTNVIITPNQTRSKCREDSSIVGAACKSNHDCHKGQTLHPEGHGVMTGVCDEGSCEIWAWCPVERKELPLKNKALLEGSSNFTVLIKNHVEFPLFRVKRSNILESSNTTYLSSCLYNSETDPFCPVFRLGYIVEKAAGIDYSQLAINGGVINIIINWNCDLDWDFMTYCRPEYSFRRLDNPNARIAAGWNFRHSESFSNNLRTLYKSYGILFVVNTHGRAGKFDAIPTFLNLGAGLAVLGVTTIICDIIVLYFVKDKEVFRSKKYLKVQASDAFRVDGPHEDDDQLLVD